MNSSALLPADHAQLRRRVRNNVLGLLIAAVSTAVLITHALTEAAAGSTHPLIASMAAAGLGCLLWTAWHATRLDALLGDL